MSIQVYVRVYERYKINQSVIGKGRIPCAEIGTSRDFIPLGIVRSISVSKVKLGKVSVLNLVYFGQKGIVQHSLGGVGSHLFSGDNN